MKIAKLYKHKNVRQFIVLVSLPLFLIFGVLNYWVKHTNYIINYTGSMPYGLYKKKPFTGEIKKWMDVLVCVPDNAVAEGIQQGYLHADPRCKNKSEPLIKTIIATNGDIVRLQDRFVLVKSGDQWRKYFSPIQTTSLSDRPVRRMTSSKDFILKNQVWAWGEYNSTYSWDSRYFGPIDVNHILAQVVPVFVTRK